MLLGSDSPPVPVPPQQAVAAVCLPLDQGARDAILGGTAARIFGLAQESRLRSAS